MGELIRGMVHDETATRSTAKFMEAMQLGEGCTTRINGTNFRAVDYNGASHFLDPMMNPLIRTELVASDEEISTAMILGDWMSVECEGMVNTYSHFEDKIYLLNSKAAA